MRGNAQPDGCPLGGSELMSYFSPLWTKVHQIKFAHAGVSVVHNVVFQMMMSCCLPEIAAIKSQTSPKPSRNFYVFGPPNFGGPPKFLTEFYKSGSPSNMWQSLVMIGQATSEIRRQKRKKEDLNYSGKTEWPTASKASGRP